jgi:predicted transcriptional regulator of viral defense system
MSASSRILQLARRFGTVTRQDVIAERIHTQHLSCLVRAGELERVAPGQYRLPGRPGTERSYLAVVAVAAPKAAICLLSALDFHGIGTQLPHKMWIAIDRPARRPTLHYPPLQVVRFSGPAPTEGVHAHPVEGFRGRWEGVLRNRTGVGAAQRPRTRPALSPAIGNSETALRSAQVLKFRNELRIQQSIAQHLSILILMP